MHPIRASSRWTRGHVLGVLGALVAAVGLLAGCGGSSKKSSSSSTTSASPRRRRARRPRAADDPGDDHVVHHDGGAHRGGRELDAAQRQPGRHARRGSRRSTRPTSPSSASPGRFRSPASSASFGNFAATPVVVDGVAYFQDLDSGVYAVKMSTGKLLWHTPVQLAQHRSRRRQRRRRQGVRRDRDQSVRAERGDRRAAVVQEADPQQGRGHRHGPRRQRWDRLRLDRPRQRVNGVLHRRRRRGAVGDERRHRARRSGSGTRSRPASGATRRSTPAAASGSHRRSTPRATCTSRSPTRRRSSATSPIRARRSTPTGQAIPGTNLYTDTVDELNPATGKLIWHYQLTPHDIHDWDLNNQALITTVNGKETIISAGKAGIAIANDAQTGKLLWKTPIGEHNGHDNDGINRASATGKQDQEAAVHDAAGRARRRRDPVRVRRHDRVLPGQQLLRLPIKQAKRPTATTNSPKRTGVMVAIDQATGKIKWQHQLPELALRRRDRVQRPGLDDHVRRDAVGAEQEHRRGRLAHEAAGRHQRAGRDRRRHASWSAPGSR